MKKLPESLLLKHSTKQKERWKVHADRRGLPVAEFLRRAADSLCDLEEIEEREKQEAQNMVERFRSLGLDDGPPSHPWNDSMHKLSWRK